MWKNNCREGLRQDTYRAPHMACQGQNWAPTNNMTGNWVPEQKPCSPPYSSAPVCEYGGKQCVKGVLTKSFTYCYSMTRVELLSEKQITECVSLGVLRMTQTIQQKTTTSR